MYPKINVDRPHTAGEISPREEFIKKANQEIAYVAAWLQDKPSEVQKIQARAAHFPEKVQNPPAAADYILIS